MKCQFIKSDDTQCKANTVQDDSYCFWHSEKMEEKRTEAVKNGGNSPKRTYGNDETITLQNTSDVVLLMEQTVNDLRGNRTNARIANAIGYLAGISLKAFEQGDLAKRLEVIEYALKIKKTR